MGDLSKLLLFFCIFALVFNAQTTEDAEKLADQHKNKEIHLEIKHLANIKTNCAVGFRADRRGHCKQIIT